MNKKSSSTINDAKIAQALLACAKKQPWRELTIEAIAKESGFDKKTVFDHYPSLTALIPVCLSWIDDEASNAFDTTNTKTPPQERLFDIIMARFDVLQKHRTAILEIAKASKHFPDLASQLVQSHWTSIGRILKLARLEKTGSALFLQKTSLLALFHFSYQRWEKDESEDLSKTMASLDRSLRKFSHIYT